MSTLTVDVYSPEFKHPSVPYYEIENMIFSLSKKVFDRYYTFWNDIWTRSILTLELYNALKHHEISANFGHYLPHKAVAHRVLECLYNRLGLPYVEDDIIHFVSAIIHGVDNTFYLDVTVKKSGQTYLFRWMSKYTNIYDTYDYDAVPFKLWSMQTI